MKKFIAICLLLVSSICQAELNVTLPWTQSFDTDNYSNEVWLESDCGSGTGAGHTWRNTPEYCWEDGCADFKAPSINCASIDGGVSAYGKITWTGQESTTTALNIRFLLHIGNSYTEDMSTANDYQNKLVDIQTSGGTRRSLVTLNQTFVGGAGSDTYSALGFYGPSSEYIFNDGAGSDHWIENAAYKIDVNGDNNRTDEWLCVEHQTTVNGTSRLKITETDGTETTFSYDAMSSSGNIGSFYIGGYFNSYMPTEQQSNHLRFDKLSIARNMTDNTWIGCPSGFNDGVGAVEVQIGSGGHTLTPVASGGLTLTIP